MIAILFDYILPLLSLVLLILLAAFFSSSETALCSISQIQLRQMTSQRQKGAKNIAQLKSDMDLFITTVLTGNNFVSIFASSVCAAFAINIAGPSFIVYITGALTVCLIIFGEIIPKTIAGLKPKTVATRHSGVLLWLEKAFFPIIYLFLQFTRFVGFVEKHIAPKPHPFVTLSELKTLIDVGQKEGALEQSEKTMLYKIFKISDLCVKNIMRHRSFIKSVSSVCDYDQVIQTFAATGYSRLPVFEGDAENIIGMLHYKSVMFNKNKKPSSPYFAKRCMTKVLFVPETLSAIELLQKFKAQHKNIAVAVNEHGSNSGIVTMDDILHVVLGRLSDEFGNEDVLPEDRIKVLEDSCVLVPGDMRLDDVNQILNLSLQSSEYETLAGWLLEHFDYLPQQGESLHYAGVTYTVQQRAQRKITKVKIDMAQ